MMGQSRLSARIDRPSNIDLVIFDMDGVIFEGRNFWLDLHRVMQTETEALRLWNTYGHSDYAQLSAITVEQLWRGQSAEPFFALIAGRRYVEGVFEVFSWLKTRGTQTAIISTGPFQLAERAQRDLHIDRILANRAEVIDYKFTGTVEVLVDENHKDEAALRVMADFGIPAARTAMIGDTLSDARMAEVVGLPIAYDPEDPLLSAAVHTVLSAGHLRELTEILT